MLAGVDPITWAGLGIGGLLISLLMKKFVTKAFLADLGDWFEAGGYYLGKICTVGLSHWKYTKPLWNNIVEPYVVLIVKQLDRFVTGLTKGLLSDNPSAKE